MILDQEERARLAREMAKIRQISSKELAAIKTEEARRGLPPITGAFQFSGTVSTETITRARKKPQGVSDVRWRIELSRRRMVAQTTRIKELPCLIHPDLLLDF